MFIKFIAYLNRPFPIMETVRLKLLMPFGFGGFIFFFLYVFSPFELITIPEELLYACTGFALITFSISLINNFLVPIAIIAIFKTNKSTIISNLIVSFWYLLTIGIGNWVFSFYFLTHYNEPSSLMQFLFYTVAVGLFPIIVGAYLTERGLNKHNNNIADKLNDSINVEYNTSEKLNSELIFTSDITSDIIKTTSDKLVCIKSDGNYCEFYIQDNSFIERKVMRFTMKNVANVIENIPNIIRVHRSYFVNINKVSHTSGTARNISLHIDNMEFIIPVSRINEQNVTNAIGHKTKL